jgi:hypothetical protein
MIDIFRDTCKHVISKPVSSTAMFFSFSLVNMYVFVCTSKCRLFTNLPAVLTRSNCRHMYIDSKELSLDIDIHVYQFVCYSQCYKHKLRWPLVRPSAEGMRYLSISAPICFRIWSAMAKIDPHVHMIASHDGRAPQASLFWRRVYLD